jgi:hypothetical protein
VTVPAYPETMTASSGSPDPARTRVGDARRRATLARERAAHQSALADRHEGLAVETGRDFHVTMAATHRRIEERHLTAARLQETYARRMTDWLTDRRDQPPLFMTGVADACGTPSAALTLVGADLTELAVAASDERSRHAQELEYVLSAGPAREAVRSSAWLHASGPGIESRWPGYGIGLAALGLVSVVALPLRTRSGCIGALTVFDLRPDRAASEHLREVAEAMTDDILFGQDADGEPYAGADHQAVVHQAAGMVSVQARCSIADALALIKARAFATEQPATVIAQRILSRELSLG